MLPQGKAQGRKSKDGLLPQGEPQGGKQRGFESFKGKGGVAPTQVDKGTFIAHLERLGYPYREGPKRVLGLTRAKSFI